MGILLQSMFLHAKHRLGSPLPTKSQLSDPIPTTWLVPKGYFAVYVGKNEMTRFIVPISYLKHPAFQALLDQAAEEFGFDQQDGAIKIPCAVNDFVYVTSSIIVPR